MKYEDVFLLEIRSLNSSLFFVLAMVFV